ncbi:hypothetical protein ACFE04_010327 [Oxalis oulophora]
MHALIPSCCTSFSLSNAKFGSKLKDLTTKFEKIVKDKNDLGLIDKSNVKFEKRRESTPLYDQSRVYGRDAEKERISQLLLGGETSSQLTLYSGIEKDFSGTRMLSYDVLHTILPKFKCLKVLSLYHYAISELPNNINVLKLLRHLDLSWSHITRLPDSATTLYNIQTLILYQCSHLVELPKEIKNLIELHKLDLDYTKRLLEMPSGIHSLTKLQTLSKFIVSKGDKHQIRELQGLTRLRGKLSIYGLDNVQDIKDVRSANLKGKEGLDDIALIWSNEFYDSRNTKLEMQVLDLLEPNKNLKVIKIESYGGNEFSSWLGNPCFANLESVTLLRCKKCKSLPSLGKLSVLKYMRVKGNDGVERVGPEFFSGSKSFPMLDTLEFDNMTLTISKVYELIDPSHHTNE